ncbi:MAG: DUF6249 domain-containing protein [Chthoniobacterales bacterium]
MKTNLLTSLCSLALALTALGQTPTIPPDPGAPVAPVATPAVAPAVPPPAPAVTTPPAPAVVPSPTVAMTPQDADDLESRIEKKVEKGVHITFGDDDEERAERKRDRKRDRDRDHVRVDNSDIGDGALMAIPIVGIIFTTLFGAPVMIVGIILFFSYWKQRQLHRTVRMMVEKGQPVPEGLFASPSSPIKQRSDMRRGVVLVMVGLGIMIFFAAVNDWEGGAWALGIIPFLIGCGHLLVWKLETNKTATFKTSTDNPPPLP